MGPVEDEILNYLESPETLETALEIGRHLRKIPSRTPLAHSVAQHMWALFDKYEEQLRDLNVTQPDRSAGDVFP
jgi:hypothetical protein